MILTICFSVLSSGVGISADRGRIPLPAANALNKTHAFLEKDQIAEAIETLASFNGKGHDHHLVFFTLGNCYMLAGRFEEAGETYLKAIERSPDYAPAWFNLAKGFFELKQYHKAGDAFVNAYDVSTDKNPETLYYASAAYFTARQPKPALDTFNRLLALHEGAVKLDWKATLVQILLASDKPRDALPVIEELAQQTEGKAQKQWQEVLLYQYLSLGMNRRALEYANELTMKDPLEPQWWKGLAHLNLLENRNEDALVALTVYGHLTGLSVEEKILMADISLSIDIPVQSAKLLEEILSEKWDIKVVEKLAGSYLALHKTEDALKWVEKGLRRDAGNEDLIMLKGNLLYAMEAFPDAMAVFGDLVKRDKTLGKAWLMLGYAAWNAEYIETAYKAMKKAVTFPGQQKSAQEALLKLDKIRSRSRTSSSVPLSSGGQSQSA